MWQKHTKISPIKLNLTILALAAGVLFLEKPEINLTTQGRVDYKAVQSVRGDYGWDELFGRVLSSETEPEKEEFPQKVQAKEVDTASEVTYAVESITLEPVPLNDNVDVESIIRAFASEYGVDPEIMLAIARCESSLRAHAINGPFGGIYQFLASTWSSNRKLMGLDPDPRLRFNATESARTAAFKMSRDGFGAWPACSRKALHAQNI